jgi:hypothetical protein
MTAATVTTKCEGGVAQDSVMLTVTDGETYTSRLGKIYGVQCTWNEDLTETAGSAYPLNAAFSGRTVTFHCDGITDKKVFVTVFGRK